MSLLIDVKARFLDGSILPSPTSEGCMRSILVTVDDTPSAIAARALAVALARQCGARVRGVTALDVSDLEGAEAIPIGGAQFGYERYRRRQELAKERRTRVAQLPELFERSLAESGMQAACTTINADIRAGLLRIIETCDLVVTGRDTEFHLEPLEGVTPLVDHIIAKGCRPVVVCGPEWNERGPVVVAYDGSAPSAKALQVATLMGIFGSADVRVLSVAREGAAAAAAVERARTFLGTYGVATEGEVIESTEHPADLLARRASELGARLLVMGAFGHRGFREILFGSTTRRLFDSVPVPLFIHH